MFYNARFQRPTFRPTIGTPRIQLADALWKSLWPFILTNIIAAVMILCMMIIGALEIASLAKGTNSFYGKTASTGAGFWCGIFFFIAALFILWLNFIRRIRFWTLIATIATSIAAAFALILLGLDAKAVSDGNVPGVGLWGKTQVLAAQLAFAIVEFLLCVVVIVIYISVSIIYSARFRQQRSRGIA